MADAEPVKDPTKPKFWRLKNIALLASSAILPLAAHSAWTWATDRIKDFDEIRDRLKELEVNAASRNAIWGAINDVKAKQSDRDVQIMVMQRLFEREWGRGTGEMEKTYTSQILKLEEELEAQRTATTKLLTALKAAGVKISVEDVSPTWPKPKPKWTGTLPPPNNDWENPPAPAPVLPPVDPDKLREQYEQRFPRTPVQQQRK